MDGTVPRILGKTGRLTALCGLALAISFSSTEAQEEPETGWFYTAELSLLFTGGNSDTETFGLNGGVRYLWENATFALRGGTLRSETGTTTRTAVGTPDSFTLDETSDTRLTAENYFVSSRFDRSLSEGVFLYLGAGWERNTFAGFDNRWTLVGGLGNTWVEDDETRFKTSYGLTYTSQDDVVEDPSTSDTFAGLQASLDFMRQLTGSASFESLLVFDQNLNEGDDRRGDWTNSLVVDLSGALSFKTSLRLLWDNLPALTSVPLEQPAGTPTGDGVLVPLDKLDRVFTIALVANF